jgi:RimJ/RimL family protein N-acetyltransferase
VEETHHALHPRLILDDVLHDEVIACLGIDRERAFKARKKRPSHISPSELTASHSAERQHSGVPQVVDGNMPVRSMETGLEDASDGRFATARRSVKEDNPANRGSLGLHEQSVYCTQMEEPTIITPRLRLRDWLDADFEPFAAFNADPLVMEFFVQPLDRAQSDSFALRAREKLVERSFGLWAVKAPGIAPFYVGLAEPGFQAPFTPCVEIGWRLAREYWGRGFATEAAVAVVDYAFDARGLDEVVSFTARGNQRSRQVMERLGMRRQGREDFDHPNVPEGHPL